MFGAGTPHPAGAVPPCTTPPTQPISDMDAADILVRRGLLTKHQVSEVRAAQNSGQNGSRVEQTAVQMGYCTEEAVLKALGDEVGLDYIDLAETQVDLSLLKDFPPKLLHRQALFPVRRENGSLVVATSDPFDLYPLDELSASTGLTVVPVLASRAEIAKLIKTHLGVGSETVSSLVSQSRRQCRAARRDRNRWLRAIRNGPGGQRHSAGQRNPARSDRIASQRRAHRAAIARTCGFVTASTACCTRSRCRRKSRAFKPPFSAA